MFKADASNRIFDPEGPPVFVSGIGVRLPEREVRIADAVADGRYREENAERDGYVAVRISDEDVPTAAAAAGRAAVAAGGGGGEDLACVTFSGVHAHGHRGFWQPAAGLQRALGADRALAWTLQHGCNGQMLALVQGAALVRSLGGDTLHVAADRFDGSGFDRWSSDTGLVYGDAATAVRLSGEGGFARILHMDVESLPDLEAMHRAPVPSHDRDAHWNITETKRLFVAEYGREGFLGAIRAAAEALKRRLPPSVTEREGSLDGVVTPFVGRPITRAAYGDVFHPLGRRDTEAFGRSVGHTGAGDQVVGLHHLLGARETGAGERYLLIGAGAGFSIGAILLELVRPVRVYEGGIG